MTERTKMLRSLIIMVSSGIVVFEKSWDKTTQDTVNQWGGLIRATYEYSSQSVGYPVSYLETPSAALSITTDQRTGVLCAIIHSNEDTNEFGELIAKEILRTFLETYPQVDFSKAITNKSQFSGFGPKIVDCINRVADSILHNLASVHGIEACLLVYDDGTESIYSGTLEDNFSVIANFRMLLRVALQLMREKEDAPDFMLLEMGERLVFVHGVGRAKLVTLCLKKKKKSSEGSGGGCEDEVVALDHYYASICRHQKLLNRVFMLSSYFTSGKVML